MLQKLSIKMTILYGSIIVITIMSINIILIKNYEGRQLQKNELEYLTFSSVLSRLVRDEIGSTYEISEILDEYFMMLTTPILQLNEVVGVVLISTSVAHIKSCLLYTSPSPRD